MHKCSGCKRTQDEVVFYKNASRPSGMSNYCKECENSRQAKRAKTPEFRQGRRKYKRDYRQRVIDQLGGKCACCGESQFEFLQFDHINNDGAEHRKQLGGKANVTVSVVAAQPERFQVLCCNCNFAKGMWGTCPHSHPKS